MKFICLIFIFLHASAIAQISPGPRSLAMGSSGTALQDVWSLQHNPAGIAHLKRPIFALAYQRHFSDQELSTQKAVFAIPFDKNVIGLSFQRYGFNEYLEQVTSIAYAKNFSGALALSIAVKHHQLSVAKYGSERLISVDAGMQYRVNDKLWIASHLSNPAKASFNDLVGTNLPVGLSFGFSYVFSDKVLVISDVQKVLNAGIDTKVGMEYKLINWFALRGGLSANPFKQYGGFGINYQRFALDVAISSHLQLGYSPNLAFSYEF
ncbi:hypothetical protein [Daejeonella sp.]|uniref:hypothetical protein n=1 Tax=Daejeonella sp. TaxID=2805397 RepID=UPI0025C58A96|nr:hypothetical protein [Daejeonella sp.]